MSIVTSESAGHGRAQANGGLNDGASRRNRRTGGPRLGDHDCQALIDFINEPQSSNAHLSQHVGDPANGLSQDRMRFLKSLGLRVQSPREGSRVNMTVIQRVGDLVGCPAQLVGFVRLKVLNRLKRVVELLDRFFEFLTHVQIQGRKRITTMLLQSILATDPSSKRFRPGCRRH